MTDFLVKFSLILLVFLFFYKFFLEREKMLKINRFLLLFALVFSLVIPFVSFEFTSENSIIQKAIPMYVLPEIFIGNEPVETSTLFTLKNVLWSIYWFGFSAFLFRFIKNLTSLLRDIHKSKKIKKDGFTLVLIPEKILPYSFWNYVFVNQNEYENNLIDEELFVHEKAHITQEHSLDILFIEILQIAFWFHPLIYFYKKAMKLNHEFLADQKVNEIFNEVVHYQKLLLQKAVEESLIPIASNLNYLLTKKRFIMMTKQKSNFRVTIKMVFTILIFSILFISCVTKHEKEDVNKQENPESIRKKLDVTSNNQEKLIENVENNLAVVPDNQERVFGKIENKLAKTPDIQEKVIENAENISAVTSNNQEIVYITVEVFPEFEGGMNEFRKYVKENLKFPEVENDVKGKIWAQFIVEIDGSLSSIEIVRDLENFGKDVRYLLENSPKWKPGYQNGQAVRVQYTLPVDVKLTAKK